MAGWSARRKDLADKNYEPACDSQCRRWFCIHKQGSKFNCMGSLSVRHKTSVVNRVVKDGLVPNRHRAKSKCHVTVICVYEWSVVQILIPIANCAQCRYDVQPSLWQVEIWTEAGDVCGQSSEINVIMFITGGSSTKAIKHNVQCPGWGWPFAKAAHNDGLWLPAALAARWPQARGWDTGWDKMWDPGCGIHPWREIVVFREWSSHQYQWHLQKHIWW